MAVLIYHQSAIVKKQKFGSLGRELNILGEIINAKPTDGLWDDGRTDEDQLGLNYKELEEAMSNPNSSNREKYEKNKKIKLAQNGINSSMQDSQLIN